MATVRVALVDYGAGNLRSIARALDLAGADLVLAPSPREAAGCDALIVPGVGAFGAAMERLHAAGFPVWLRAAVASGVPLIGVCLGMQLLFRSSEESDGVRGLNLLAGEVRRLPAGLQVPHMGWNEVVFRGLHPFESMDREFFYFAHSYVVRPTDQAVIAATASYSVEFPAAVRSGCVAGVQFHPEKSGAAGLRLFQDLVRWCADIRTVRSGL